MLHRHVLHTAQGEVHYWLSEPKPRQTALVFLHGLTTDHRYFEPQFAAFSKDFQLLAWDAPMHGASTPYADFNFNNAVKQLRRILDKSGIKKCVLLGHSLGGYFAQLFIKKYPELVRGFLAIETTPLDGAYYSELERHSLAYFSYTLRPLPDTLLRRTIAMGNTVTPKAYDYMLSAMRPFTKSQLINTIDTGYRELIKTFQQVSFPCPVWLVNGALSQIGNVRHQNHLWSLKEGFPLRIIANAGHCVNYDNPEDFNKVMATFLASLGLAHEVSRA